MPPKHLNTILLSISISLLCYMVHRRARTAMMVGDAVELINMYYVDPVDRDDLLNAAMSGLTDQLDEHSSFIPSSAYDSFQDSINQEFAGIGIYVAQPDTEGPVRVITPLVGSPALHAGMLPNDEIMEVNGDDVSCKPLAEVSDALKGPVGTDVNIVVRREEQDRVALKVQRATIELDSVVGDHRNDKDQWVYRLRDEPSIAYVRLTTFGEKTFGELTSVLENFNNDFEGLVLDLRDNSGGLLYTARDVSDIFLKSGLGIVSTKLRDGVVDESYVSTEMQLVEQSKPIVVLVNENSASASEIVAACLQDHKRAVVVGVRTYGKGTVQNILPLQFGRSALRLTVARYYRPSGANIHRVKDATEDQAWGVMPDPNLVVEIEDEMHVKIRERWQRASYPLLATDDEENQLESWQADPQLAKAVQFLKDPESATAEKPEEEAGNPDSEQVLEEAEATLEPAA